MDSGVSPILFLMQLSSLVRTLFAKDENRLIHLTLDQMKKRPLKPGHLIVIIAPRTQLQQTKQISALISLNEKT